MVLVVDNEVRPEYRFLGPELARLLGEYSFEASNAVDTLDRFRTLVDRHPD